MKLINYKRGYNNTFNCSIHGTIEMTYKEWKEVFRRLKRSINPFKYYDDGRFYKRIFFEDIQRAIITKRARYINIRVALTSWIVKKYGLTNYKRGNYKLRILAKEVS